MPMRIAAVVCARNEADVLETHIRHAARWASRIDVVLHRTLDNSSVILDQLRDEGLPLSYVQEDSLLHDHAGVTTRLVNAAAHWGADWIVPLDADEFLTGDVASVFARRSTDTVIQIPWRTYVPTACDLATEPNVLKKLTHRRVSETPQWYKVAAPGDLIRARRCTFAFGNHSLLDENGRRVPADDTPLALAHFPVRSSDQIRRKVFGAWPANVAYPARRAGSTFQWEVIFELCKREPDVTLECLQELATEYGTRAQWNRLPASVRARAGTRCPSDTDVPDRNLVLEPVEGEFDVRYQIACVEPQSMLLDSVEGFARAYGDLLVPDTV